MPTLSTDAELAGLPTDVQDIIRKGEQGAIDMYRYFTEQYDRSERLESGRVVHYDKQGRMMCDSPIHAWFSLSYASWLTIPRLSLQEMPPNWQARFVELLNEGERLGLQFPDGLVVQRQINGKFVSNTHWNNYRRGTTTHAIHVDQELRHKDG